MDQTPISYEFLAGPCYDFKGAQTVWIKESRSGWDKRQATLMVYVAADGINHMRPLLIFKGKDCKKNAKIQAEMRQYDDRVAIEWDENAYCNSKIMVRWLKKQYAWSSGTFFNKARPHPRLLTLDVFKGHKTPDVKQAMKELNIIPSFVPAGCTGYVQVLDVAINKPLKHRIEQQANAHYEQNFKEWKAGQYSVSDRRVMLTKWVGQAWTELHKDHGELIRQTFRRVGLSLAVDGSEDREIKVKDIPDIEVGDWHLNLPASMQEDVYNALDPDGTDDVIDSSVSTTSTTQPLYVLEGEADAEDLSDWDAEQDGEHEFVEEDEVL